MLDLRENGTLNVDFAFYNSLYAFYLMLRF